MAYFYWYIEYAQAMLQLYLSLRDIFLWNPKDLTLK